MADDDETRRMQWASRRGLLELDLFLGPFMSRRFASLPASLRADYRELMTNEDQQILNWLMARDESVPEQLQSIVAAIRSHNDQQPPAGQSPSE